MRTGRAFTVVGGVCASQKDFFWGKEIEKKKEKKFGDPPQNISDTPPQNFRPPPKISDPPRKYQMPPPGQVPPSPLWTDTRL